MVGGGGGGAGVAGSSAQQYEESQEDLGGSQKTFTSISEEFQEDRCVSQRPGQPQTFSSQ